MKLEAAKLVLNRGYTYLKAAEAVNISHSAMTRWVNMLLLERQNQTPAGLPLTPEQIELLEMKEKSPTPCNGEQNPKKGSGALNVELTQRFTVVERLRARYPVAALSHIFEVRSSKLQALASRLAPKSPDR